MNDLLMASVRGKEMMSYLPDYYANSRVMTSIIDSQGSEMDKLHQALSETLDQNFIATSTWGLDIWEREYEVASSPGQDLEQRRSVVLSKIRGIGTVTSELIRNVASAYAKGTVEIVENELPSPYTVSIKFIDTRGIPDSMPALKSVAREVIPAHLDILYLYTYLNWSELDAAEFTWNQLDEAGLTWTAFEKLNPSAI